MSDRALVPVSVETWQVIQSVAPVAQASRMFEVTVHQAAVVMLKGHELGLGLASAFEYIHVIDNKPSISPKGALALIHRSGELAGLKIEDLTDDKGNPTACKVWMKRNNGFEYATTFTMADAERADIVKAKSGWAKYPANMLRWRAVGYCADIVFPDVVGGLYRSEELGVDTDADGEPIQWKVTEAAQPAPAATAPAPVQATVPTEMPTPPATELTLQDIMNAGFSAEQIVVANEGRIPATSEDCQRVMEKLQDV